MERGEQAMVIRKILSGILAILLMALPCAGCGLAEAGGVTVTDMMGREIHLDTPATRIVALTAADCEILYALGAGDTLVGRGEYCDYPASVLEALRRERENRKRERAR